MLLSDIFETVRVSFCGEDIDLNCGAIVDGEYGVAEMGQMIFDELVAVASGEHTKSEKHGYGQNEFIPWQIGAVM